MKPGRGSVPLPGHDERQSKSRPREEQLIYIGASLTSLAEQCQQRTGGREGRVWLGTNAYFVEEKSAARFTRARFGEFRLDRQSGEAVLVGLRDEQLRPL